MSIRFLTDNKSLRKKVGSNAMVVFKNALLKIVITLMPALFLINSKRTSKVNIKHCGQPGVQFSLN